MEIWSYINTNEFALFEYLNAHKTLFTILLAVILYLIKHTTVLVIERRFSNNKRFKMNFVSNIFTVCILIVVFNVWSEEIQKFAFSIAAFVVAIVIATKEFIQCFLGFIYILSSRPFRIGDWVQVGNHYGEVHSNDWAKLTLLEVDLNDYQYTGKTLYLPNSQLITAPIKNLNFLKRYAMHTFTIVRDCSVNPFDFIDELLNNACEYCSDFHEVAIRYNQLIENRLDVKISGPEPQIKIATSDIGNTQALFTIFCPTDRALEIEQQLTSDYLSMWFDKKHAMENINSEKQ
ncbi:mechanosensitive ion channel family protein [Psychromonas sp. KJ10-10]|uniref:mechanosensitive ion channel family protein n=1 Tax=Psychromonas sp. KJ10-10 TaxID=3391823 RepID=UPI0039B4C12D